MAGPAVAPRATLESERRQGSREATPASRRESRLAWTVALIALVPVVVAAARGISNHWVPAGDNAFIAVRSRDVLTSHPPLLGLWASISWALPFDINHPGPLLFDLLAVPTRLFGPAAGLPIGVAVLNGAALLGIAAFAWRRGGALVMTTAVAVAALLSWSMGSEILYEPWHAHVTVLPFLCFVFLVWSLTCGDVAALPWMAVAGTFVLQTNLSYGLLVPLLAGWGILGLALTARRARRESEGDWPRLRRRLQVAGVVTAFLVAAGWLQPLIEQFTATGQGNMTRLARSLTRSVHAVGFVNGPRLFAKVASLPPFWFRSSLRDAFPFSPFGNPLPSTIRAGLSLVVLAGVLVVCARASWARSDRTAFNAVVTAAFLAVLALATAARTPTPPDGFGTAAYQLRWVWPVAAFVWFAVILTLVRRVSVLPSRKFAAASVLSLVTVLAVVGTVPTSNQGTNVPSRSEPRARALLAQLGPLRGRGPLLFTTFGNVFDPYGPAVVAELRRRGIPFFVSPDDKVGVRQFGRNRLSPGDQFLKGVVIVVTGDGVSTTPLLASRVALVEGLSAGQQREMADLRARIADHVRSGGVHLNARGERAQRRGALPSIPVGASPAHVDPTALLRVRQTMLGYYARDFEVLVREHLLVEDGWTATFERYVGLQQRWDTDTAAVFLRPLPLPKLPPGLGPTPSPTTVAGA